MEIRFRETGQVMFEGEFRSMHPETSFPVPLTAEILGDFGADVVLEGPQATTQPPYEFSYRNGVEQINGQWFTKYSIGPVFQDQPAQGDQPAKTAAEQMAEYRAQKDAEQAKNVRETRNQRLKDSDWSQGKDIADAVSQPWAVYRQALRDVPAQAGFPWDVTWPDAP